MALGGLAQDDIQLREVEALLLQGMLQVLGHGLRDLELLLVLHLFVELLRLLRIHRAKSTGFGLLTWSLVLQIHRLRAESLAKERAHLVLAVGFAAVAHSAILVRLRAALPHAKHLVAQVDEHILWRLRVGAVGASAPHRLACSCRRARQCRTVLASIATRLHACDHLRLARSTESSLLKLRPLQERGVLWCLLCCGCILLAELLNRLDEVVEILELLLLPLVVQLLVLRACREALTSSSAGSSTALGRLGRLGLAYRSFVALAELCLLRHLLRDGAKLQTAHGTACRVAEQLFDLVVV